MCLNKEDRFSAIDRNSVKIKKETVPPGSELYRPASWSLKFFLEK